MIWFDTTRTGAAAHRSGLTRVSRRLREELGAAATPVRWDARLRGWRRADNRAPLAPQPADWLLTAELFSEAERPGIRDFVAHPPCRLGAVFHDAIPLRWPQITWPHSVARHPEYLKLLAGFDRVCAVSEASRRDLVGFWQWQGAAPRAAVSTLTLGADFDGAARAGPAHAPAAAAASPPVFLCVGIVEPRKHQDFLLEVATGLWRAGREFELHFVGRVNPHFGPPLARRLREAARRESRLHWHGAATDGALAALYRRARAVVFPTLAEGCGLPLLEALWRGVPCVASDLPALRENAEGGGCLLARVNDPAEWSARLASLLGDAGLAARLRAEAISRPLPRWADTAAALRAVLR